METSNPAPADTLLGQVLNEKYRLSRRIGEGGMGVVYEAVHVGLGKSVAIKILRDKHIERQGLAQRLVQEARLASAIRHEHIIDITDTGETADGRTYVVMELLHGETLADRLDREKILSESTVIEIALQVAGALGAAHERGIVHRDIKPENIFLLKTADERISVKVVDFGISLVMPGQSDLGQFERLTATGMVLGTPAYMSPEQARGEETLDHRVDIYAVGVIMYECLTGETPFHGSNSLGILAQVLAQNVTAPRALRPELHLSPGIDHIVMHAMAPQSTERYASAEELTADLILLREGKEIWRPLASSSTPRRPVLLVLAALATLAITAVAVALFAPRKESRLPRTPVAAQATTTAAVATPLPGEVNLHFASTPDGAEVVQAGKSLGHTPLTIAWPRGEDSVPFDFILSGYVRSQVTVLPRSDEQIQVHLQAAREVKPPSERKPRPDVPHTPRSNSAETLPNPY